ncbi:MAG: hypothetical protein FJ137_02245 [Deltaproteobacteria bacterium]|nr:hypothetical protein [Deltaproteobacteria bacterium]
MPRGPLLVLVVALARGAAAAAATPPTPSTTEEQRGPESLIVLDAEGEPRGLPPSAGAALVDGLVVTLHHWERVRPPRLAELKSAMRLAVERQNVGCETSSCLAELADAYGARWVVCSRITRVSPS